MYSRVDGSLAPASFLGGSQHGGRREGVYVGGLDFLRGVCGGVALGGGPAALRARRIRGSARAAKRVVVFKEKASFVEDVARRGARRRYHASRVRGGHQVEDSHGSDPVSGRGGGLDGTGGHQGPGEARPALKIHKSIIEGVM